MSTFVLFTPATTFTAVIPRGCDFFDFLQIAVLKTKLLAGEKNQNLAKSHILRAKRRDHLSFTTTMGAQSRDPENVSFAMQLLGVLPKDRGPHAIGLRDVRVQAESVRIRAWLQPVRASQASHCGYLASDFRNF